MGTRLHDGVADLVARLEPQLEDLARRTLDAVVAEVALYRRLPSEQLEGEVLDVCRTALRLLFASLASGEMPEPRAIAALRASAARRAEERIPLRAILAAYEAGAEVTWAALQDAAGPDGASVAIEAATTLMRFIQRINAEVAEAYLDEHGSIHSEDREADRVRLSRLLASPSVPPETWDPHAPLVLAQVRLGTTADERDPGVDGVVAARRKVRRVEEWLASLAPRPVARFRGDRGTVALPGEEAVSVGEVLHGGIRDAAGAGVLVAVVAVGPEGPAVADRNASLLADLAVGAGLEDQVVTVDDLLVPYLVARVPEVRERAEADLVILGDGPDLVDTLVAWFSHDFDRRATAETLRIHPNTLDHRLKRTAERLGVDLGSRRGLERASAVVAVAGRSGVSST